MTIDEENMVRRLLEENSNLKHAMCHYDEMLVFLELTKSLWEIGEGAGARMDRFETERLIKSRLPDLLKAVRLSRIMLGNYRGYWPKEFIMSSVVKSNDYSREFINARLGEPWEENK